MRSAASLGVRARTSATKSESVTSISCPTAETTGIRGAVSRRAHSFFVDPPQFSKAPPAATDNQYVDWLRQAIRHGDALGDLFGRPSSLHPRGNDQHVHAPPSTPQHFQE